LAQRPEKNVLLFVVTGDKGLAGAFNTNILKAASRFLESKAGKNVEIEAIGRKGRDFLRRRYPVAQSPEQPILRNRRETLVGEHVGVLGKVEYAMVSRDGGTRG
jgi:F-type H+-transporting ATPase subunit gamma